MTKEEYDKRLEKTTEKIKTDRCSEDEIANINRQKLYLAEHYITGLEQENKKYKEVIDKLKEWINIVQQNKDNKHLEPFISTDELDELLDILKGGSK